MSAPTPDLVKDVLEQAVPVVEVGAPIIARITGIYYEEFIKVGVPSDKAWDFAHYAARDIKVET